MILAVIGLLHGGGPTLIEAQERPELPDDLLRIIERLAGAEATDETGDEEPPRETPDTGAPAVGLRAATGSGPCARADAPDHSIETTWRSKA